MNEQRLMELFLSQIKHCSFGVEVILSAPIEYDDGKGNNTRVYATVKGDGFKPYKLWYDYHRLIFKPRVLPIELIYKDETDDVSSLVKQLADKYGTNVSIFGSFPLKGKIKDYLTQDSPLGHYHLVIDNYECKFEQAIEFAPEKLDVRYIFNEIVTIKNGDIIYRHERQEKELENHIPLWMLMKRRFEDIGKQNFVLTKDTKPSELTNEGFVHHLEEHHQ